MSMLEFTSRRLKIARTFYGESIDPNGRRRAATSLRVFPRVSRGGGKGENIYIAVAVNSDRYHNFVRRLVKSRLLNTLSHIVFR